MKKKIALLAFANCLILNMSHEAQASANSWTAGVGISTLGFGANIGYGINESFKIRGVVNYLQHSRKIKDDSLALKGTLKMFTAGVLADWHVMQNGFRLTGGLLYNANRLNMHGTPSKNVTVNGRTYTPAEIGEVTGSLKFRPIAPYLGIGYDSGHKDKAGFSFTADAGVLFQGKVKGRINKMTGAFAANSQALNDMKDYVASEVNKQSLIKAYPVVSIGISYKF